MISSTFRRTRRALVVALAAVIAACFTKPEPPLEAGDANITQPPDGPGGDALLPLCALYDFAAPIDPCGGWGDLEAGSALISDHRLRLTAPFASLTSAGRCMSPSATFQRATLDLDTSVVPATASTQLAFFVSIESIRYGGVLEAAGSGSAKMSVTCDTAMGASYSWVSIQRYMRLISSSASRIDFQLSTNGSIWETIGGCTVPTTGVARVGVEVHRVGSGSAVTASYESLEICP